MREAGTALIRILSLVVAVAVTACGSMSMGGGGRIDTPGLLNAIDQDDAGYVRSAVESGVLNVNQRIAAPAYPDGAPLITIAARSGSLRTLRYLISSGADLNSGTPVNETALMLAAFFYDQDLKGTPRAFERHEQAVRMLVEAGANLENPLAYAYTPLAYAAYQGNERVVRYLIERGARVNNIAPNGIAYANTPLMMAAIQGNEGIVRTLLRAGADPDIRVIGGYTAYELAAKYHHAAVARLLQCAQRNSAYSLGAECRSILGYDPSTRAAGMR